LRGDRRQGDKGMRKGDRGKVSVQKHNRKTGRRKGGVKKCNRIRGTKRMLGQK